VRPATRHWVLAGGATAFAAIVIAAVYVLWGGSPADQGPAPAEAGDPGDVAVRYLAAFGSGQATAAGDLTDDPAAATGFLEGARKDLGASADARLTQLSPVAADQATAAFHVTWALGPGRSWAYDNSLRMVRVSGRWIVHWAPAALHPKLAPGQRLLVASGSSSGPAVVDRDGKPLLNRELTGPRPAPGNQVSWLQPALAQLARGSASNAWSVVRTDSAGKVLEVLTGGGRQTAAKPLVSTLSTRAQSAAQSAVNAATGPAVLIALQPSTGDVLAVAQNAAAGPNLKAFNGLYPPGSTFKIATATAALEHGTRANTRMPCPASDQIGERTIPNDDGFALPPQPVHSAFAHSCNTTFARLAADLPPDALATAANQLGLNADFTIPGVATEAGRAEPAANPAEQVENGIGQGRVQVSPFGLALMAATVQAGKPVTPKLWRGMDTHVDTGYQAPPKTVLGPLRSMMREVVTDGTATALEHSGSVYGKTGTAQFGDGSHAHGWFTGYRGDLAFAVLTEDAGSSKLAVTVSAEFLGGL
jgi:beta-lactamase class D